MQQPITIKRHYPDKCGCFVLVLSDGQEVCGSTQDAAYRSAQRVIDGTFKPVRTNHVCYAE